MLFVAFLCCFKFLSLSLTVVISITVYLGVFLFGSSVLDSLCFLDLGDCFLSQIRGVSATMFSNTFSARLFFPSLVELL